MSDTNKTEWLDCGEGAMALPAADVNKFQLVTTRVVELKGFGRIFEVFDYSNEPEQNFELILNAPRVKAERDSLLHEVEKLKNACHIAFIALGATNRTDLNCVRLAKKAIEEAMPNEAENL